MNVALIEPTRRTLDEIEAAKPEHQCSYAVYSMMLGIDDVIRKFNEYPELIQRDAWAIELAFVRMQWLVSAVQAKHEQAAE